MIRLDELLTLTYATALVMLSFNLARVVYPHAEVAGRVVAEWAKRVTA